MEIQNRKCSEDPRDAWKNFNKQKSKQKNYSHFFIARVKKLVLK